MSRLRLRLVLLALVAATAANAFALPPLAGRPAYTGLLVLSLGVLLWERKAGRIRLELPATVALMGVAVLLVVPSVLASPDRATSWSSLDELAKELLFLAVVATLTAAANDAWLVARTLTIVLAVLGGLAVVDEFVLRQTFAFNGLVQISESTGVGTATLRHQGPFFDPNFYGRILVLGVPLALALLAQAWQQRDRLAMVFWSGAGLAILGGVYLTGSRGAMIASFGAVVLWMLLAGPTYRRMLVFLPLLVVPVLMLPGVGSRLLTLDNLTGAPASFVERDPALVEREAALKVTWAIFEGNPVLGIGPGRLDTTKRPYVAAGNGLITRDVAAHNSYAQIGAESGVIGLLGWLVFLGGVVLLSVRAAWAHPTGPRGPTPDARLLLAGTAAAMAAWMVTSLFLHLALLRPMLIVAAVAGVLVRRAPAFGTAPRPPAGRPVRLRRPVAAFAVSLLVVAAIGGAAYALLRTRVWVAEVPVALEPAGGVKGQPPDAYRTSLTSRRTIVATYAAVMREIGTEAVHGRGAVSVVPARPSGDTSLVPLFTIRVSAPNRAAAEFLARRAAQSGAAYVRTTPQLADFGLTRLGAVSSTPATTLGGADG